MSAPVSSIRQLMDLRHIASERNGAVETGDRAGEEFGPAWAFASRVWSRQSQALLLAVIGEPPTNSEDALSVLCCLAELRDRHADEDNPSAADIRDVTEMTDVAIHNCIAAIARTIQPERELTETENVDVAWSAKQVARWLPCNVNQWVQLAAERARLDAAEDAATKAGNEAEAAAHQTLRFEIEDRLMAMPARDGADLGLKVLIAIGQDRASIPYHEKIEADARRLSGAGRAA